MNLSRASEVTELDQIGLVGCYVMSFMNFRNGLLSIATGSSQHGPGKITVSSAFNSM